MGMDLRTYKAMVLAAMRRAQDTHKPEVFENTGPDHARIVLDVLLDSGSRSVDVIAGRMDKSVWSSDAIVNFLSRNPDAQMRVLLDETSGAGIPQCSVLKEVRSNARIKIRWYPSKLARHLCVVDKAHVRVEANRLTREASITLGDPEGVGKRASEVFEVLWNHSAHHEMRFAS